MQATCPNSDCGAAYTLTAQNVGREFACRKCGTKLRVETDGLHLAEESMPAEEAVVQPPVERVASTSSRRFAAGASLAKLKENVFDLMFCAGAVLVILFTFFPVLDHLRGMRYKADIAAAQTEFNRADRDITARVTDDIKKNRDKKLESLRDAAEDHDEAEKYAAWWYGWGTLIGFLLLAVASIVWMGSGRSRTHRVVAAIVICTELLLVFIVYVVRSQGVVGA